MTTAAKTKVEPGEKRTARFSVSVTPSELEAFDQWAWARRIRSISDTARQLMLLGLAADAAGWTPEPPATPPAATATTSVSKPKRPKKGA